MIKSSPNVNSLNAGSNSCKACPILLTASCFGRLRVPEVKASCSKKNRIWGCKRGVNGCDEEDLPEKQSYLISTCQEVIIPNVLCTAPIRHINNLTPDCHSSTQAHLLVLLISSPSLKHSHRMSLEFKFIQQYFRSANRIKTSILSESSAEKQQQQRQDWEFVTHLFKSFVAVS